MHDRPVEAGQRGSGAVGVNGIVVAGDLREGAHVHRRGDGHLAPPAARGVVGVVRHRSPGAHRIAQLSHTGSAPDREALLEHGVDGARTITDVHRDRHDAAHLGVHRGRRRRRHDELRRVRGQRLEQLDRVVEMHQAQQTLDHVRAGLGDGATDRGEHRRPARAHQGVGDGRAGGCQWCTEGGGDAGVIGHPFGIPLREDGGRTGHRFGQRRGRIGAGGDGQHRAHGGRCVGGGHHRRAAVDHRRWQREGDVDPGPR